MTAEGVLGQPRSLEHRKLLMLIAAGLVVMAAELAPPRIECKTEAAYVTDQFGTFITDQFGNRMVVGRERKCEINAGQIRIPLPVFS